MNKLDTKEAVPLIDRALVRLLTMVPTRGQPGYTVRRAVGDLRANLASFISADTVGAPLDDCFNLARLAGATQAKFASLRGLLEAEAPLTLGATLLKNVGIVLCLATEARIVADTAFVSRQDVDEIKPIMAVAFDTAEELAANEMDAMTYRSLIQMHGALINYLVDRARPLPRLLSYEFGAPLPSLVIAYRLYKDAGRADEVRAENRIVHPAFSPIAGKALSA